MDLGHHLRSAHFLSRERKFNCPRPSCDRKGDNGFLKPDHVYDHIEEKHEAELKTQKPERWMEGIGSRTNSKILHKDSSTSSSTKLDEGFSEEGNSSSESEINLEAEDSTPFSQAEPLHEGNRTRTTVESGNECTEDDALGSGFNPVILDEKDPNCSTLESRNEPYEGERLTAETPHTEVYAQTPIHLGVHQQLRIQVQNLILPYIMPRLQTGLTRLRWKCVSHYYFKYNLFNCLQN